VKKATGVLEASMEILRMKAVFYAYRGKAS
jgi:hypothetical protein